MDYVSSSVPAEGRTLRAEHLSQNCEVARTERWIGKPCTKRKATVRGQQVKEHDERHTHQCLQLRDRLGQGRTNTPQTGGRGVGMGQVGAFAVFPRFPVVEQLIFSLIKARLKRQRKARPVPGRALCQRLRPPSRPAAEQQRPTVAPAGRTRGPGPKAAGGARAQPGCGAAASQRNWGRDGEVLTQSVSHLRRTECSPPKDRAGSPVRERQQAPWVSWEGPGDA